MFHRVCHFQLLHKLQENSKDRILKSWGFFKYDLSVSVTPCFGRFLRMQMRKCSKNHCVRKPFVRVFLRYGTLREHFIHTFFIRLKRAFWIKDENIHCKQRVITIISHFSIFALIESGNQHSKYIAHDFYQQQKRKECLQNQQLQTMQMKEKQTTQVLSERVFLISLNYRNISSIFLFTIFQAFEPRAVVF